MELGRVSELTVLTEADVRWIRSALPERDAMAKQALDRGHGRSLKCAGDDGRCRESATHYSRGHRDDEWHGWCARHWRTEADPQDLAGLGAEPAGGP